MFTATFDRRAAEFCELYLLVHLEEFSLSVETSRGFRIVTESCIFSNRLIISKVHSGTVNDL